MCRRTMTEIKFRFETRDGTEREGMFTADDVNDDRVAWNPDVARSYAQHIAAEEFDHEDLDVNTVEIVRMGTPHAEYDETGGIGR